MSDQDKLQRIRERFVNSNHFPRVLGFELDSIGPDRARMSVELRKDLLQLHGVMHGGAIASLIDTAVALAIAGNAAPEDTFTTVEMKVNYLAPISGGRAIADAKLIRSGRRIIVAECDVTDSDGQLAAKALVTYIKTR